MDKYTQRKRPNMPKISWTRSLDIQQEEDTKRIYYDMWKDGLVSTQTLFDRFPDLNLKTEARNLEKEKGTIFDGGSRTLPAGTSTMDFDDDVPGASKGKPGSPLKPSRPVKPSSEEGVEETSPEGTTPEEIPPEGTPKPSQSLEPAEPGGEGPEEGRPV